jgi:ABC-type branched-subunit amino acid transport system ATPase component
MAASAETLNFSSFEVETPSKRFGDSAALTSISFSVREKAIVGVIGPNGSWKTILSINHFPTAAANSNGSVSTFSWDYQLSPLRTIRNRRTFSPVLFLVISEFGPKQIGLSITIIIAS